jgi:hypothetical protein
MTASNCFLPATPLVLRPRLPDFPAALPELGVPWLPASTVAAGVSTSASPTTAAALPLLAPPVGARLERLAALMASRRLCSRT